MAKVAAFYSQLFDYLWTLLYSVASLCLLIVSARYLNYHFTSSSTQAKR
jgi:hypothetical protein